MSFTPTLEDFRTVHDEGRGQVVYTEIVADLETPVSAFMKLTDGRPNCFLLESVEGGAIRGRYSFIGLKPDLIWRAHGDKAEINRSARFDPEAFEPCAEPTLESFRKLLAEIHIDLPPELPPMSAGLFGYMAYDTVKLMERLPSGNRDALGVPDALFVRPTVMAIFDSVRDMVTIVTPVWPEEGVSARQSYARACERLADSVADFDRALPHSRAGADELAELPPPTSNTTRSEYHAMVEKAKEYIRAGDIFQIVPSQRFEVPFTLPPLALYRALRRTNPSPFMYFLDFGDFSVVGSSPEILVRVRDGRITLRPLAGTRPRGATPAEDAALAEELLSDPKELAEHLMLLDLGRNDVGRVAKIGTVNVTEKFVIERYSHVMHIVSNVEGELDDSHDALDALIGGFPAGTVSGAPKVRAMEIIEELEKDKRHLYAGGIGYFSAGGAMDTAIVLRTAVVKDGVMHVQAGGGVVADSDPEAEYQETVNKAKALMRAAEEAVRFAARSGNMR
ncbi:anthranilate synthase component I [Minwuia thermotolerans]|uniref:Anthranilate synthase component 1 n=1 Tax=Minwuia thermotolerans TaxID=2056226 RepID=A0A2M9G1D8_9PROT|nr:anthranilate synthase component I [Minwuia thermotolerans]PJK29523.1 anthranilate synthase component I [Minwuia thermotolerans]